MLSKAGIELKLLRMISLNSAFDYLYTHSPHMLPSEN
jgi:hypothetical protein